MDTLNSYRTFEKTCTNRYNHKEFKCSASKKCCGEKCCRDEDFERYIRLIVGFLVLVILCVVCWSIVRGCILVLRSCRNAVSARGKQQCVTNTISASPKTTDYKKVTIGSHNQQPLLNECSPGDVLTNPRVYTRLENIITRSQDQLTLLDEGSPGDEPTNSRPNTGLEKITAYSLDRLTLLDGCSPREESTSSSPKTGPDKSITGSHDQQSLLDGCSPGVEPKTFITKYRIEEEHNRSV